MKYKRILLKLSGESLSGTNQYGIDPAKLEEYASEIKSVFDLRTQVAVVLGGGNIFRGFQGNTTGIDRVQGDYMGMLATMINSLGLQAVLSNHNIPSVVMGGIAVDPICEKVSRERAIQKLEEGKVVIISGGTGNPFFTTDSAAALRAVEIKADAILKGTRVDGVYNADPEKDPNAERYDKVSFEEVIKNQLRVMDQTAFTLCRENNLPIVVFNANQKGNLKKIVEGEHIGTLVAG
jgi:uridylate kinase